MSGPHTTTTRDDASPELAEFWGPPVRPMAPHVVAHVIALVDNQQRISDERRNPRPLGSYFDDRDLDLDL